MAVIFAETRMYPRRGVAVRIWRAPCVRDDALPTQLYQGRGPSLRGHHPLLEQLCSNWVWTSLSNAYISCYIGCSGRRKGIGWFLHNCWVNNEYIGMKSIMNCTHTHTPIITHMQAVRTQFLEHVISRNGNVPWPPLPPLAGPHNHYYVVYFCGAFWNQGSNTKKPRKFRS